MTKQLNFIFLSYPVIFSFYIICSFNSRLILIVFLVISFIYIVTIYVLVVNESFCFIAIRILLSRQCSSFVMYYNYFGFFISDLNFFSLDGQLSASFRRYVIYFSTLLRLNFCCPGLWCFGVDVLYYCQ